MALHRLDFSFNAIVTRSLSFRVVHYGVVGSGDLEVLLEAKPLNGAVNVNVVTPVNGFEHIWQQVLDRFVQSSGLANVVISINDNNATPAVVVLRLQQAMLEIEEGNDDE